MKNLLKAEMLRERLISFGYVALYECECIGGNRIHRYILVRNFKEGEGPPCYLDDYHIIHSEKFLEILVDFLNESGVEIIVPDNPTVLLLDSASSSSGVVEL